MRRVAPPASSEAEERATAAAGSGSAGVPGWLEALLGTRFFLACAAHPGSPRNESNMFCIDCRATPAAFCYYCRSHRHASHRVIQVPKPSPFLFLCFPSSPLGDWEGKARVLIDGSLPLFLGRPALLARRYGGRPTTTWCASRRWRTCSTSPASRPTSSTAPGSSSSTSARSRAAPAPQPGRPPPRRTTARSAAARCSTPSASAHSDARYT
jgi:hypothetical protein